MRNKLLFIPILIIIHFVCALKLQAQSTEQDTEAIYTKAKAYFRINNYAQAKNGFSKLLAINERNPYALYANYFYAISSYQLGDTVEALDKFRKVHLTHNKWDKKEELNVWYGKLLLENGDLFKGLQVINSIEDAEIKEIAKKIEANVIIKYDSLPMLQRAMELNPYDSVLALQLARIINNNDLAERPVELQEFLIESFNLDAADLEVINKKVSQMKQTYNVGVLMPFMVSDLSTGKGNKGNQFILDLYQGINEAVDYLNGSGERIRIFAFDTKRDSLTTQRIINSGDLLAMDLIIGPLYPVPARLIKDYSRKQKINLVNPLSTNAAVIGNNKYSFLLNSAPETRAHQAAKYAAKNFTNKHATIFYGKQSEDSLFAYAYKKYLEADSFEIKSISPVKSAEASSVILKSLTQVYEKRKDSNGRLYVANNRKVRVNKGDSLVVSRDGIGHIMVASEQDKALVFNVLSAVETRKDSVPVIGMESWIDFDQISFEQLERLGVVLVGQNFFDFNSEAAIVFKKHYKSQYNKLPSQFSYSGYESMRFFGKQLLNYGNYFQYGLYEAGYQDGFLYEGFDYTNANDNQYVPIIKLIDSEVVISTFN